MTIFFFVVGLEVKREIAHGELRDPRKALLPVFAALGVVVPAAIYLALQWGEMAVAAGLAIGKPVGIILMCLVAVRLGVTSLPDRVTWGMVTGGACLAGVGFTMALFLNALAFPATVFPELEAAGKVGTLAGSLVIAVVGAVILSLALRRVPHAAAGS